MEIIEDRALLVRVRNPAQITTIIPKSKQVSPTEVLVWWGLEETKVLRNLNIAVPSPIERRYKWPGRYAPMAHQRETSAFLTLNKRAFCFNDPGTGKTASAIWAADFLMEHSFVDRAVIICPISIMDTAWRADLFSVAMHRTVGIAYGHSAEKRRKIAAEHPDFLIVNYEGLDIIRDEIKAGGYNLFIADEASHYKSASSKRWKVLKDVAGPDSWLWMMTGTPAAQGPEDAYGLAKLVNPGGVPRTFGGWRDKVMTKVSQFRWAPKVGATDMVFEALQPAIRFTKEECLDLPDMVYVKREVQLTKQQEVYYKKLKQQMMMEANGATVTAMNAAVSLNKLLQISAGAVYTDDHGSLEFDIAHRYEVLLEVIEETAHKVLVFIPFKHTLALVKDRLRKDGVQAEVIAGAVPVAERTRIFTAFQTEKNPRVLLIQPQAAAHGVTLTAADTVVWWSPVPSLETYAQANARVHRVGQDNKCTVVQLQGSGVERHIYSLLDNRIDAHDKLVDLYKKVLD